MSYYAYIEDMTQFPIGFKHYPLYFSPAEQQSLIDAVKLGVAQAPFYQPTMPRTGTPLTVVMSNFGPLGWVTDKDKGYRYETTHKEKTSMGLHVDQDEHDTNAPVVSVSLGDPAMFRIGGPKRGGPTQGLKLFSGDVVVMGGQSRHCYHGVSKIFYGESALVPRGGRINLTMRRVTMS